MTYEEQKRRWKELRDQIKRNTEEKRADKVEQFIAEVEKGFEIAKRTTKEIKQ